MNVLYYLVVTLHVIACFFLIGVVLLQQGKGQDLASAFGGGGTQAAFGPRGSATVLSRATAILAGAFMLTSLGLSLLRPHGASVLDRIPAPAASVAPAAAAPAVTLPGAPPAGAPTGPVSSAPAAAPGTTAPAAAAPAPTATPTK